MKVSILLLIFPLIICYLSPFVTIAKANEPLWNYFVGENIQDISISADGKTITIIDAEATVSVLDQFGNLKWTHQFEQSPYGVPNIGSVCISKDGTTIIASCLHEHEYGSIEAKCFNEKGDTIWSNSYSGDFERLEILSPISISDDGNIIALIGMKNYNRAVFLFSREGTEMWVEEQLKPTQIKLSNDGKLILINENSEPWQTTQYCKLHLLSIEKETLWKKNHEQHCVTLDLSSNGSVVTCGFPNNLLYSYNQTGHQIFTYSTASNTELFTDVSLDGSTIALGSDDQNIVLFNQDGTKLWSQETSSPIKSVSLSEKGEYLAVGCENGIVYLFSKNSTILWSYKTNGSTKISLSNNGQNLAIGSSDTNVYFIPEFSSTILQAILIIISSIILTHKKPRK